ncbi:MAG: membrane protein insertion efficiency factor YidD [Phycisphaerae bacterium]
MVLLLVFLIRCYQGMIRPLLIGSCKFCPTCSEYAIEAIQSHGPIRGVGLTLRRLTRCHPFSPGGIDPVPAPTQHAADADPHARTADRPATQ